MGAIFEILKDAPHRVIVCVIGVIGILLLAKWLFKPPPMANWMRTDSLPPSHRLLVFILSLASIIWIIYIVGG